MFNFFKSIGKAAKAIRRAKEIKRQAEKTIIHAGEEVKLSGNRLVEMIAQLLEWVRSDNGIVTLLVAIAAVVLYIALGSDPDVIAASGIVIAGTAGGRHVVDGPLTTDLSEQASPGLLRNEIDDRIVKIRPMSTPLDQISRWGGARACGSMVVDYYAVDSRKTTTTVAQNYDDDTLAPDSPMGLRTTDAGMFERSETILVPSVKVDGGGSLVLYVVTGSNDSNGLTVLPVNSTRNGQLYMPALATGTKLVRMGRAAAELDVQTAQFEAMPKKAQNYCQIFKAQVEQSTFQKIANKEVGWTFSDQEEAAIIDMRLGMEKNFLFGVNTRVYDPQKRDSIFLTGGIWNQVTREDFHYNEGTFTFDDLVSLSRAAFTENAGSSRKILIGGTGLIEALHKMKINRVISADQKVTRWGIDFTEMVTKFGTLYVVASEIFDECDHPNDGMVIDPEYITKFCHVPFRTEKLDLRTSGQRNTDAIVITEASCLVLRYPSSHLRIVAE